MVEITISCPMTKNSGQVRHLKFACNALLHISARLLCLYRSAVWILGVSDWHAAGDSYVHHTVHLLDHLCSTVQPYRCQNQTLLQGWDKTVQHIIFFGSLVLLRSMIKCSSSDVFPAHSSGHALL